MEPDSSNFGIIRRNLAGFENVKLIRAGLWNRECYLTIKERNGGSSLSFTVEETDDKNKGMKAVTSAMLINDRTVDVFKIDIEGSEYVVFDDSSEEWIDNVRMFIIEFHDRIKEGCSKRVMNRLLEHKFKHEIIGENHIFTKE